VWFETKYKQHGWWEIFAVINMDIREGDFNYLKLSFKDDTEFDVWIKAAKALSLYDTGVAVGPADKVLVLSTCNRNYGKGGRQLILAVLLERDQNGGT
jgi:hypothetical protein